MNIHNLLEVVKGVSTIRRLTHLPVRLDGSGVTIADDNALRSAHRKKFLLMW